MSTTPEVSDNEFRAQRIEKLQRLRELGIDGYGEAFARDGTLAAIRADFAEGRRVRVAGRLTTIRRMGKSIFADLRDGSDRFQLYLQKDSMEAAQFEALRLLDLGDSIGCSGELFVTRMGEPTLRVESWTLLSKALRPLPEKWHGLRDVDARYRQRYLDLIANPAVRTVFEQRSLTVRAIRDFLHGRGFIEVETPMMQPRAGGATARPFVTRYEALNSEMYLRIAPELYLKRLLVGGFDKVFELNRNFRNEGLDRTHNPEFTMLEIYEAYSDRRGMQALVQDLIVHVAQTVFGTLQFGDESGRIDLTPPWREVPYRDLVRERVGADWFDLSDDERRERARGMGLDIPGDWDTVAVTHEVYEKLVERTLVQPTFVTRPPAALIPLAKRCADDPSVLDVFELEIGGREIAPGYSELNDPLEQRERLSEQAAGREANIDEDFLAALEHGMPPAGGMGIGIDRLLMLFTGAEAIRDVILFPQLKPRGD